MKKLVITDTTKTQMTELAKSFHRAVQKGFISLRSINDLLKKNLGDAYSQNLSKTEYYDKYGNNIGWLDNDAGTLEKALSRLPEERMYEFIEHSIKSISGWKKHISDKPAHPKETYPEAMERVLNNLAAFIQEHEAAFNPDERQLLERNVEILRETMREISTQVDEAKRLCGIVIPKGTNIE